MKGEEMSGARTTPASVKQVSVILVNYNTKALCEQAVASLSDTTHMQDLEVIVVDNSSRAEERMTQGGGADLVISGVENRGFGHACNIGAHHAAGKILLFLNSDTILHNGAVDTARACLERMPDIGALGIHSILKDGKFDAGCRRGFPAPLQALCYFLKLDRLFPRNRFAGGYHMTWLPETQSGDVDCVSGSFLMIPRDLFSRLGEFDEVFFMYGEDIDLCYRVKQAGFRVYYCAEATMVHLKGQSGLHTHNPEVLHHFYNAMLLFYDKHYRGRYGPLVCGLVHLAVRTKYRLAAARLGASNVKPLGGAKNGK